MARRKKDKPISLELATAERWQHGHMERDFRPSDGGKAGGVIGVRDVAPLMIDRLYRHGGLGEPGKGAQRRKAAAEWLHALWGKTGLHNVLTSLYEQRGDKTEGQSDAQMWNESCYHDAMKAMRPFHFIVAKVCCHDIAVSGRLEIADLRTGLDLLARHRGIA